MPACQCSVTPSASSTATCRLTWKTPISAWRILRASCSSSSSRVRPPLGFLTTSKLAQASVTCTIIGVITEVNRISSFHDFSHSVVFWFGDLNFRIEDLDMQVVKSAIDNNKYSILWEKDQVRIWPVNLWQLDASLFKIKIVQ